MNYSSLAGVITALVAVIGVVKAIYETVKYFHPKEETLRHKIIIVSMCTVSCVLIFVGVFVFASYGTATALPVSKQPIPVVSTVIPNFQPSNSDQQQQQETPSATTTPSPNTTPQPTPTPASTPTLGTTSTVVPATSPTPTGTAVVAPTPTSTTGGTTPPPSPGP